MAHWIDLILLFFFYSFIGWCIEVTLKYRQFHRFINRGFFTGPILPIYGSGAALITVAVGALSPVDSSYGTTFLISFVLCGAVEYLTSYAMEKRFHARWWDYSQKPMNLHGRVWIGNLLLFGLGGVAIMHLVNPLVLPLFDRLPLPARQIAAGGMLALFAADYVATHFVLKLVKSGDQPGDPAAAERPQPVLPALCRRLSQRDLPHRAHQRPDGGDPRGDRAPAPGGGAAARPADQRAGTLRADQEHRHRKAGRAPCPVL